MSALHVRTLAEPLGDSAWERASRHGHTLPAGCVLFVANRSRRARVLHVHLPDGPVVPVRVKARARTVAGPFTDPAAPGPDALAVVVCPWGWWQLRLLAVDPALVLV